jgi:hypothetical protein
MADNDTVTTASTNVSTDVDNTGTIINKTVNKTVDITNDPNAQLLQPTWVNQWKEVLSYVFAAVIAYDFIAAPTIVMFLDAYFKLNLPPWAPLTLGSGGLFYVSMSVILGTAAYGSMVKARELIRNLPDRSDH